MKTYGWIYDHVQAHLPDQDIELLMPKVRSSDEIQQLTDDRIFSEMSRRVFRAGLKFSLVDSKWPAFEKAFFGFDPEKVAMMSDEQLENLMQNDQIIRHWGKIKATRANAYMITNQQGSSGSFAQFIAQWPCEDIIGLWMHLKKEGKQLGGKSGGYFLRMIGKDTFLLTDDVVAALKAQGIIDKAPTAKRDLQLVQNCFNEWQSESGRPLSHISKLLSLTVGW